MGADQFDTDFQVKSGGAFQICEAGSASYAQQYWQNADDVTSISKASNTDLSQLQSILTRATELTTSGSSGLTDSTSLHAYATETDQILEQALTQANSQYSGSYLHGCTVTNTPPFVAVRDASNKIISINYGGDPANYPPPPPLPPTNPYLTNAQISISATSKVSPYTDNTENLNISDMLNNMVSLRDSLQTKGDATQAQNDAIKAKADAIKASDPVAAAAADAAYAAANATITAAAATLQTVTTNQGKIEDSLLSSISRAGAVQYRLQVSQSQDSQNFLADEALISRDADSDFATATVQLNRAQTAYSAAVQSGAKIANVSLLDYIR